MGAKMDDIIAAVRPTLVSIEGTSCDEAKVGFKIHFYLLPLIHCKKFLFSKL